MRQLGDDFYTLFKFSRIFVNGNLFMCNNHHTATFYNNPNSNHQKTNAQYEEKIESKSYIAK